MPTSNPENLRQKREYYAANRDVILTKSRQRYAANREHYKELSRKNHSETRHWHTYQHVNAEGAVVYVGGSNHDDRQSGHKARSPWWSEVSKVMKQEWKNRAAASVAEAWLIAIHKPRYNKEGM